MPRFVMSAVVALWAVFLWSPAARGDATADRAAIADAFGKLAASAEGLARTAKASEDRAVRKKLAPRATELADELTELARRTRKDVGYEALARDALATGRDAAALVELADEAEDKAERKSLRAQAALLEQGVAATRKVLETLASRKEEPAKPQPMRAQAFDQLVAAVRGASFDDDKVGVVRHAAGTNHFSAAQIAAVMGLLAFDDGKIDAAAAMWPRMVDPENSFVIFNKLAFDSAKDKLRKRVAK